jgi:hypothetical protein
MQAYRTAFRRPLATIGEQADGLAGRRVWLLPNPSGLQARYRFEEMTAMFTEVRLAADAAGRHRRRHTLPGDAGHPADVDGRTRPPRR